MEAKEYIHLQLVSARSQVDGVLNAITNEQFNWTPPGTGNSISATFIHMLASEDRSIQAIIQGKPRVWEAEGWGGKLGLEMMPDGRTNWDQVKSKNHTLLSLLGYEQSVRAATDAYLASLTSQELDRKFVSNGQERIVADVVLRMVNHIMLHTGEMAAIKGILGIKGLPV